MNEIQTKRLAILALIIVFLVIIFGNPHFRRMIAARKTKKILAEKIRKLKRENEILEKRLEELDRDRAGAYYRIAREELGMIKNGENKYRLIEKQKD